MYTIEVTYQTGDSFNSYEETNTIGLVWEDKQLARKALAAIKEHYTLYSEQESYSRNKNIQEIRDKAMSSEWYLKAIEGSTDKWTKSPEYWQYNCAVEMDDGSYRNIPTNMWCGYFESLHTAKIVNESDDEDEVNF